MIDYVLLILLGVLFLLIFYKSYKILKNQKKIKQNYLYLILIICVLLVICIIFYENNNYKNKEKFQVAGGQKKIKKLRNMCGFKQDDPETQHCFADGTHHTCCLLGPKTREYADKSGNPIGSASKRSYSRKNKRSPGKKTLTPWCTCSGSAVCSYYADKFKDGTRIKFINNPNDSKKIRENVSSDCETHFRDKFKIGSHGTPGVGKAKKGNHKCNNKNHSKLKIFS